MKIKLTGTTDPERKIHAIKGLRAATGLGLRDAKYICDDVFNGLPTVVELPDAKALDALKEANFEFTYVEPDPKELALAALRRLPLWMTVADVLAVVDALA